MTQQPDDDLLAPTRWENGNANVRTLVVFRCDVTVLRDAPLADIEFGQNFNSNDEVLMHPPRNLEGLAEHAVDAITHTRRRLTGLDVNVARVHRNCFFKDLFLNANDGRALFACRTRFLA